MPMEAAISVELVMVNFPKEGTTLGEGAIAPDAWGKKVVG